jgi:hypothetical protein
MEKDIVKNFVVFQWRYFLNIINIFQNIVKLQ